MSLLQNSRNLESRKVSEEDEKGYPLDECVLLHCHRT